MLLKLCCTCKKEKPIDEFNKNKNTKDGYAFRCRLCRKEKEQSLTVGQKQRKRAWHLRTNYGMTIEEYSRMFEAQQGCCVICGLHQSELDMSLVVDHDHETGRIRGLLCRNCNCRLGHYESGNNWYKENELIISGYIKGKT
ncbi:hypothetical protein LCGC14_1598870 [marine sediment metagenome]|uniref:Recombination endonuclease VII n=1 Tax=marine sediment metagenome TaxID=412755 RepID=A0A0F9LBW0_9ZZZZ